MGSLQSLDSMEWWNGTVESQILHNLKGHIVHLILLPSGW